MANKRKRRSKPTQDDVMWRARTIWNRDPDKERVKQTENDDFRSFFGCSVGVFLTLWSMLLTTDLLPEDGTLEHLLWTLMFLKLYSGAKPLCALAGGVDPETFRKWVWMFVDAIADLEDLVIIWENRFKQDKGNDCLTTCDGTDFRIPEHGKLFYSHKYKKSGLRYEVCLCILTGDIVWINGPYPCGKWPDITIFRNSLLSHLAPNERVEADDGYIGEHPQYIKCPKGFANDEETLFMQQRCRNRQESINARLKFWGALRQIFRHDIPRHGDVFRAIVVVCQLAINAGEKLFECGYRDPPYDDRENTRNNEEE